MPDYLVLSAAGQVSVPPDLNYWKSVVIEQSKNLPTISWIPLTVKTELSSGRAYQSYKCLGINTYRFESVSKSPAEFLPTMYKFIISKGYLPRYAVTCIPLEGEAPFPESFQFGTENFTLSHRSMENSIELFVSVGRNNQLVFMF